MAKFLIIGIIVILLAGACGGSQKPNVRKFEKDRPIMRLDKDLFALDIENPNIDEIHRKYGRFFDVYAGGVLQLGAVRSPDFKHLLTLFLKDSVIREVYDTVAVRYSDMREQEQDLSSAWAYYAYYFPGKQIPQVYTHISGFNQSIVVDSAGVGISLDNYLENCIFYSMLATPVPMYARLKMTSGDIPRDVLAGWLNAEFFYQPQKNDLISGMIYQGKIVYLLGLLLPDYERRRLFGFTQEQLQWCENNESQIWGFLIENDYLFSTQQKLIMKYLNEAPYTSGMPVESPGRAVVWSGYRIVDSYMKKSGISPGELMKEQDYHKMLRIAGYRP